MRKAFEGRSIGHQKLSAPDGRVAAQPRSVPGHADDFAVQLVFRHAAGNVRVMMLHGNSSCSRHLLGQLRAEVSRVQIVRDRLRSHMEQPAHALQRLLEKLQGFEVLQVAQVLAGQSKAGPGETQRALLLRAACQHFDIS